MKTKTPTKVHRQATRTPSKKGVGRTGPIHPTPDNPPKKEKEPKGPTLEEIAARLWEIYEGLELLRGEVKAATGYDEDAVELVAAAASHGKEGALTWLREAAEEERVQRQIASLTQKALGKLTIEERAVLGLGDWKRQEAAVPAASAA